MTKKRTEAWRWGGLGLAALLALGAAPGTGRGASEPGPRAVVQETVDRVLAALQHPDWSREERRSVFEIHLRLKNQDVEAFDLEALAEATEGFSGAEIEQVIVSGLYRALHAKRGLDAGILLEEAGATIPLSVARAEDVAHLRTSAKGRYVGVS